MRELRHFIKEYNDELHMILDSIKAGVWITDEEGRVIFVNKESEKTGGLKEKELLGRSMEELLKEGYILYESSVIKALSEDVESSIIQELGEGGHIYATSVPVRGSEDGKTSLIVCTERDITETIELKKLLSEQQKLAEQYQNELDYIYETEMSKEDDIISESVAMHNVLEMAVRTAKMDVTTILLGESGTGKEQIANVIYKNSARNGKPFIKVNCAAIPEALMESEFFGYEQGAFTGAAKDGKKGFFEMANDGVLFLDEVGDLPIQMQPKLLRAIQEKEIIRIGGDKTIPLNVRIISATNKDLKEAIQKGEFREDLYYRLNIVSIEIPPLRKRKEDIWGLAEYFVDQFNREYGVHKTIDKQALEILEDYDWPGNVRELRNVVESLVVGTPGDSITKFQTKRQLGRNYYKESVFDYANDTDKSLGDMVSEFEKNILLNYLQVEKNASGVARALKVDKSTISRKLKKYGINV